MSQMGIREDKKYAIPLKPESSSETLRESPTDCSKITGASEVQLWLASFSFVKAKKLIDRLTVGDAGTEVKAVKVSVPETHLESDAYPQIDPLFMS